MADPLPQELLRDQTSRLASALGAQAGVVTLTVWHSVLPDTRTTRSAQWVDSLTVYRLSHILCPPPRRPIRIGPRRSFSARVGMQSFPPLPAVWSIPHRGGTVVHFSILTPVSAIKGLPHLLHQGEVLSFRGTIINGFYVQFWV